MRDYSRYESISIELNSGIAVVSLNRPDFHNAINYSMMDDLRGIWEDVADDDEVDVVILTGKGRYFSVGGDVKVMSERPGGDGMRTQNVHEPMISRRLVSRLVDLDKPVICAINGDAVGLACTIALFCDITIISDQARIGDTHVSRVGLVAGDGSTSIWPLLIGLSKAKEYLMRGTLIPGREAERIGLVNHCVASDRVLPMAREIAAELAAGPRWATQWTKLSLNQILKDRVNRLLETSRGLEALSMQLGEHKEATKAFSERRKPDFRSARDKT